LKVLGRAIPSDKHLLVSGLKEMGRSVAVTGDGINDVEALKTADVGFAMGSGCSVAKEASSMIITDDNFEATMKAVMWGRNIYDNVRRFLQFQVTCNITCLVTVFFVCAVKGDSYMNTVQLLWINLIMDTFAALALASEKPHPSIIKNPPTRKGETIMTPVMWRQIYGVSAYIILVIVFLTLFGPLIYDFSYSRDD